MRAAENSGSGSSSSGDSAQDDASSSLRDAEPLEKSSPNGSRGKPGLAREEPKGGAALESNLFLLAARGDLERMKNVLCLHEIRNGRPFDLKVANKEGVFLFHAAAYYGQTGVLEFLLSLEKPGRGSQPQASSEAPGSPAPSVSQLSSSSYDTMGINDDFVASPVMDFEEPAFSSRCSSDALDGESFHTPSAPLGPLSLAIDVKPPSSPVNIRSNRNGGTPLHYAVVGGNRSRVIEFLLGQGADPGIVDDYGQTPRELAANHGHKRIVKLLSSAPSPGAPRK